MLPNAVVSDFREPVAHAHTPFWYLKLPTDGLDGESEPLGMAACSAAGRLAQGGRCITDPCGWTILVGMVMGEL